MQTNKTKIFCKICEASEAQNKHSKLKRLHRTKNHKAHDCIGIQIHFFKSLFHYKGKNIIFTMKMHHASSLYNENAPGFLKTLVFNKEKSHSHQKGFTRLYVRIIFFLTEKSGEIHTQVLQKNIF